MFALLILRTYWGYAIFKWLGDRVTEILDYSMAGVLFVFGDTYADHFFATKVNICNSLDDFIAFICLFLS